MDGSNRQVACRREMPDQDHICFHDPLMDGMCKFRICHHDRHDVIPGKFQRSREYPMDGGPSRFIPEKGRDHPQSGMVLPDTVDLSAELQDKGMSGKRLRGW